MLIKKVNQLYLYNLIKNTLVTILIKYAIVDLYTLYNNLYKEHNNNYYINFTRSNKLNFYYSKNK